MIHAQHVQSGRGFQKEFQGISLRGFRGFQIFLWELCVCIKYLSLGDPCCGSGGFFLAAQVFLADPKNYALDTEQKKFLKNETFYGNELVPTTFKLCLMNLYLHNIGDIYGKVPVTCGDSLLTDPGYRVDYVLTIICSQAPSFHNVHNEIESLAAA